VVFVKVKVQKRGNKDDFDHEIDIQESIRGSSLFSTIQINNLPVGPHATARERGGK
jgi:hypothetical protein